MLCINMYCLYLIYLIFCCRDVCTVAGTGEAGKRDGRSDHARFSFPYGVAYDNRNKYVSLFSSVCVLCMCAVLRSSVVYMTAGAPVLILSSSRSLPSSLSLLHLYVTAFCMWQTVTIIVSVLSLSRT